MQVMIERFEMKEDGLYLRVRKDPSVPYRVWKETMDRFEGLLKEEDVQNEQDPVWQT